MALTLGEVLRMDAMADAALLTKNCNVSSEVKGISIMEAPDIMQWVEGGEIILTNLYAVSLSEENLSFFVDSLHEKPVCALVVKLGRYMKQLPGCLLAAAEKLGFAIFEIPPQRRFTDIMYPVMAALFDSRVVQLSYLQKTRNLLTGLALKNAGIPGITKAFSEIVGNPALVYDAGMEVIYATDDALTAPESTLPAGEVKQDDLHYIVIECTPKGGGKPEKQYLMPIMTLEETAGYLAVAEARHRLSELDFFVMHNAMTVLSLEMLKDFAVGEVKRGFRIELFEAVSAGAGPAQLNERAEKVGLRPAAHYAVFSMDIQLVMQNPSPAAESDAYRNINWAIGSVLASHKVRGIYESRSGRAMLLVECGARTPAFPDKLAKLAVVLKAALLAEGDVAGAQIGFTSRCGHIAELTALYADAHRAMEISAALGGAPRDYEKLGILKLLPRGGPSADFIPIPIRRLAEYDSNSKAELLATLSAYFDSGRNAKQAADALFVHYKTMIYRLNKISEVAGLDFKDHGAMLEAELGLRLLQAGGTEEAGPSAKPAGRGTG